MEGEEPGVQGSEKWVVHNPCPPPHLSCVLTFLSMKDVVSKDKVVLERRS